MRCGYTQGDAMNQLDLTVNQVLEHISANPPSAMEKLRVFWLARSHQRDQFVIELNNSASDLPVVGIVVRGVSFLDPNSLSADVINLMNSNQGLFTSEIQAKLRDRGRLDLVLIAKTHLHLAGTDSQVTLPIWSPVCPGREEPFRIEDLTWQIMEPIDSSRTKINEIASLIYQLDGALLDRLITQSQLDRGELDGLFNEVRIKESSNTKAETLDEFLDKARLARLEIHNPSSFRPSSTGPFIVGRLWSLAGKTAPESMTDKGKKLARALGLSNAEEEPSYTSIISVLGRPNRIERRGERQCRSLISTLQVACRLIEEASPHRNHLKFKGRVSSSRIGTNLLLTIRSVGQLTTAAAHSDTYPCYPVHILQSLSIDLRSALIASITFLQDQP